MKSICCAWLKFWVIRINSEFMVVNLNLAPFAVIGMNEIKRSHIMIFIESYKIIPFRLMNVRGGQSGTKQLAFVWLYFNFKPSIKSKRNKTATVWKWTTCAQLY